MIVKRNELTWFERLYLPALIGGLKVTTRHFINNITGKTQVTQQYPEEPTKVLPGYRGAPYLVRDQDGNTKCVSCQLCEFVCPPKAITITPPGPGGPAADRRNAGIVGLAQAPRNAAGKVDALIDRRNNEDVIWKKIQ